MKLNKLLQARNALAKRSNEQLPAGLAYKILKFMKASDTEEEFYRRGINTIIEKYGQKDANGNVAYSDGGLVSVPSEQSLKIHTTAQKFIKTPPLFLYIPKKRVYNNRENYPVNVMIHELREKVK